MNRLADITQALLDATQRRLRAWAVVDGASWVPTGQDPFLAVEADVRGLIAEAARARADGAAAHRVDQEATRRALTVLVEVSDALDRVVSHAEERAVELGSEPLGALAGNASSVAKLLLRGLGDLGVEVIDTAGEFDPHVHTVGGLVSDPERVPGSIVGEVRRGFRWGGEILRKSEVLVVGEPTAPAPEP